MDALTKEAAAIIASLNRANDDLAAQVTELTRKVVALESVQHGPVREPVRWDTCGSPTIRRVIREGKIEELEMRATLVRDGRLYHGTDAYFRDESMHRFLKYVAGLVEVTEEYDERVMADVFTFRLIVGKLK